MSVRWGVLGCGRVATNRTIPEGILAASNATLVAVADNSPTRARATAEQFGVRSAESVDELLADPSIEAVYIAVPPRDHHELTISAAREGKHILCEKPIALNAERGQEMVLACRAAGVQLGIGFMMRYHAAHEKMAEMIAAGEIGEPVAAHVRYSVWAPPIDADEELGFWLHEPEIAGGGPVMDMGVHAIDLLTMLVAPIDTVASFCDTLLHGYAVEDTCSALFKFRNGAHGTLECYMSVPNFPGRRLVEVYGSKGLLVAENTISQLPTGELSFYRWKEGGYTDADRETVEFTPHNMYQREIELFSAAVEEGRRYPVTGEVGVRVQQVADAIYRSSAEQQYITLPVEDESA